MAPPIQLLLCQSPQVRTPGGAALPLALPDAALLAWLALEGPTPRARLAALLWPHSTPEAARNSLRQRLFKLRREFGVDFVVGTATLSLASGLQHDLADADTVLGDTLGPFAPEFNTWLQGQRTRRREHIRLRLLESCQAAEGSQRWPEALAGAMEMLALDPLSEAAHRLVIRLHYLAGDRAAALLAFERCVQMLHQEFGAQPSAPTLALRDTLRQADGAGANAHAPQPSTGLPAALLRPPRMVGRQAALQAVLQALRSGHVVACVAEAGMGKTRLAQALQQAPPWAGALRPLQVLDDLHLAERDLLATQPLAALRAGAADPAALGQRLLLLGRPPAPGTPWQELLDTLADRAALVQVPLPPLDEAAVGELLHSLQLQDLDGPACAAALHPHTGGNPLFVLETLRSAWAQGQLADAAAGIRAWPQVQSVAGLLARRLQQLSAPALALARCASVAGSHFGIDLAAEVMGVSALALASPLAELQVAQVLNDTGFVSTLVAQAVAQGLPQAVARHLHGRVAAWLQVQAAQATAEWADDAAAAQAGHWLQSDSPALAVPALKRAAHAAARALRPKEQCNFLRQAARLQAAQGERAAAFDTLHALLEVQIDVARDAVALALCDELQALADTPAQQVRVLQQRSWLLFNRSEGEAAFTAATHYLAAAEAQGDATLRADAHHLLGLVHSVLRGEPAQALAHMQQAAPVVTVQGAGRQRAEFHGSLAVVLGNNGLLDDAVTQNERALEAARGCGYLAQQAIVLGNQALILRVMGRLEAAHGCVEQALHLQRQHDQLDGANNTLAAAAALIAHERGHYGEALERLDEAEALLSRQGLQWLPLMHARRATVWMSLGQTARASQALGGVDDPVDSQPFVRAMHGLVRARLHVLMGQNPDEDLARALALAPTRGRLEVGAALRIEQALRLPPAEGLVLLAEVLQDVQRSGYRASVLAATVRVAQLQAALGDPAAHASADAALTLRPGCAPILDHAPALWLSLARTLQALGRSDEAAALASAEAARLHSLAHTHVAEAFRESFLQRNPANRELLMLAARWAAGATA